MAKGNAPRIKPPRAAYRAQPTPRVVKQGTKSRPSALPRPRLGTGSADAAPKIVRK